SVQFCAQRSQVRKPERSLTALNTESPLGNITERHSRTPDVDAVACVGQSSCQAVHVIAHPSDRRRVFGRYYVPLKGRNCALSHVRSSRLPEHERDESVFLSAPAHAAFAATQVGRSAV